MADTFKCAVCHTVKPWNRQNASGLFLLEADPPDILVCRDCEAEGGRRNQQHTRLHAAAGEMFALLESLVEADDTASWDEDMADMAREIATDARAILTKIRGAE